MTIEEGVKLFLREKSAYCAERSMEYYRDSLGYFQKWSESEGKTEVDGLNSGDLLDYQAYLRERKKGNGSERIKNTSVNTYMRSVRIFVKWLEGEGFLSDRLKVPKRLRDDSNQIFVLTMDEVALLDRVVKENVLSFRIQGHKNSGSLLFLSFRFLCDERENRGVKPESKRVLNMVHFAVHDFHGFISFPSGYG